MTSPTALTTATAAATTTTTATTPVAATTTDNLLLLRANAKHFNGKYMCKTLLLFLRLKKCTHIVLCPPYFLCNHLNSTFMYI